jgi:hypothetical protein
MTRDSRWRSTTKISYFMRMRYWNLIRAGVVLALAALIFSGCSTFNYEWRQAANKPTPTNDITGRWEGNWLSHANGHNDKLRCLIKPAGTNRYDAKFHAAYSHSRFKWLKVHFGYTVPLQAQPATNGVTFTGREDLGALAGGVYTYEGHANTTNFFSTYKCKYDHGVFQMTRPPASGNP